jgi:hypothetical protein
MHRHESKFKPEDVEYENPAGNNTKFGKVAMPPRRPSPQQRDGAKECVEHGAGDAKLHPHAVEIDQVYAGAVHR